MFDLVLFRTITPEIEIVTKTRVGSRIVNEKYGVLDAASVPKFIEDS